MVTRRSFLLGAGAGLATFGLGAGTGAFLSADGGWRRGADLPRAETVGASGSLPVQADVVVVGAGIAGLSTAHALRDRGLSVVVLEKGVVSGEQSSRAFGWIYSAGWHPDKLELANRSKTLWADFARANERDIGYRRTGNLSLLESEEAVEGQRAWLAEAKERAPDMDVRLVSGAELERLTPGAGKAYQAALYSPSDGIAEPTIAAPRIARALQAKGVPVIQRCAVRSVETEGGAIRHVVTEQGVVRTSNVVVAGGAWSRLFLGNLGVPFPQLGIASPLMRVTGAQGPDGAGYAPNFTWRRQIDGNYVVGALRNVAPVTRASFTELLSFLPTLRHASGLVTMRFGQDFFESLRMPTHWSSDEVTPFERNRFLSAKPYQDELDRRFEALREAFPDFRASAPIESWGGVIDATPDSTPIISAVDRLPGLSLISGFSGNGLTVGPAAGEMMAQIIAGETPTVDPAIYRYDRFFDGSDLTFRH
ncbi:FAD-binding oxidoreductase [Halomonas sp. SL1]|uniref:NAD(P)/FAD-dependent oxidoreductase n=1 Tax=Halomonas sp. SL1 TaxID=2137478 RepID=UPI000D16F897|nr:FAD-dependent oxidoreductase [Halomonas sp. SL1]RAH39497.1 FAD-dependent oxidoreductase [Halomonas sp. SL1]